MMVQVTGLLPLTRETRIECLAPGFGPGQPQPLQAFGDQPADGRVFSLCLSAFQMHK